MNIVLIGYRGTGKSSVAKELSKLLGRKSVSTDQFIEKSLKKTIPQIINSYGWDYFREHEQKAIEEISDVDNFVIDCGGGAVLTEENIANLRKNGKIFLLIASPETIRERIKEAEDRPSLTKDNDFLGEVEGVLEARKKAYAAAADVAIDTENSTAKEAAEKIIKYLKMTNNLK